MCGCLQLLRSSYENSMRAAWADVVVHVHPRSSPETIKVSVLLGSLCVYSVYNTTRITRQLTLLRHVTYICSNHSLISNILRERLSSVISFANCYLIHPLSERAIDCFIIHPICWAATQRATLAIRSTSDHADYQRLKSIFGGGLA